MGMLFPEPDAFASKKEWRAYSDDLKKAYPEPRPKEVQEELVHAEKHIASWGMKVTEYRAGRGPHPGKAPSIGADLPNLKARRKTTKAA